MVFEATYPRPTRSRTYASPASLPRPSPGSLPARSGSPLAGRVSHPLDDERNLMESSQPPIPIDQQSLVALFFLSSLAVVNLYRALGGGWSTPPPQPEVPLPFAP
jgi:hypothetical protein